MGSVAAPGPTARGANRNPDGHGDPERNVQRELIRKRELIRMT
jgi:hypothetical protein